MANSIEILAYIFNSSHLFSGKEFAGESGLIENPEAGVWIVKMGKFIPDSEKWLHEASNSSKLNEALNWASQNKTKQTDLADLERKINTKSITKRSVK